MCVRDRAPTLRATIPHTDDHEGAGTRAFLRIDKLQVEMPAPTEPDSNAAAAVQELLGGRFGEMTLMNYMYQSFNFRGRDTRQYYALISNIATEELGHIELVAASINSLLNGVRSQGDPASGVASFEGAFKDARNLAPPHNQGHGAMAANSMGQPWRGDYVFNSGNLILDLLHNFFLENGAYPQAARLRDDRQSGGAADARLSVRARRRARPRLCAGARGAHRGRDEEDAADPQDRERGAARVEAVRGQGLHRKLYRFSPEDYKEVAAIWQGRALTAAARSR